MWVFHDYEYENSIKVPFIVSHPGHVPESRAESAMVSAYDVMPTLLDYLGLPIPSAERNLPGQSFAPLLADRLRSDGEPSPDHECGRHSVVICDEYGPVRMVRTQEWKYVYRHAHGPHELYDLVNDPDERYVDPVRDGLRQDGALHGQTELVR